jgi:tRNA threonylcarbamoyl adenosine modification protein YjeE
MSSVTMSALLTESALEAWGAEVGAAAVGKRALPLVLALRGPLGAGKSVLARAVARGAGVTAPMPSPTYNLVFSYEGRTGTRVHHLDLYRLDDPADVWELGWEELGLGDEVVLIEWPERAEALLPADRWDVFLEFERSNGVPDSGSGVRNLRLLRHGAAPALPRPSGVEPAP